MSTSKVIFNIPSKVKKAAAARAEREGLTLTTLFTQTAQAYAEGKIGIHIVETPKLRPEVARRIDRAVDDYRKGKNISPAFGNSADAITWLRSAK